MLQSADAVKEVKVILFVSPDHENTDKVCGNIRQTKVKLCDNVAG